MTRIKHAKQLVRVMKQMVYVYIHADCQSCAVTDAFHRLSAVVALFAKVTRRSEELKWEVDFFLFATIYNICCYKRQTNTNSTRFFPASSMSFRKNSKNYLTTCERVSFASSCSPSQDHHSNGADSYSLASESHFLLQWLDDNEWPQVVPPVQAAPSFWTAQSGVLAILKGLSSTPSTATDRFWPRLGLSSH